MQTNSALKDVYNHKLNALPAQNLPLPFRLQFEHSATPAQAMRGQSLLSCNKNPGGSSPRGLVEAIGQHLAQIAGGPAA